MCLFSIIYQALPGCPVFVFANREESPSRPSVSPAIWDAPASEGRWLGGKDLQAGGTWLGVNRAGLVVAVTNRRKSRVPENPTSRGLLCRDLLDQGSLQAAKTEFFHQWNTRQFAGFNLMLISAGAGRIFSAEEELREVSLTPGHHVVTNGEWNDPHDKRIARVRRRVQAFQQSKPTLDDWIHEAKTLCGQGEEAGGDAICIPCTQGWGTVSSSIIALTDDPAESRYLHAAGSPAMTEFHDLSSELASLFEVSP